MLESASIRLAFLGVAAGALWLSPADAQDNGLEIVDLAQRYCINPDGDHRMTWQLAEQDGFMVLTGPQFDRRRAAGVHDDSVRVLVRDRGEHELRVTTAATFIRSAEQGTSYFRWCWVSASPMEAGTVTADLQNLLSNPGFRVEAVRLFAWIPRPGGTDEFVSRRRFLREGFALARDQGMRQVSLKRHDGAIFIGYGSPRDEATYREFDWGGPAPAPAR